jgi:hypothetical protein
MLVEQEAYPVKIGTSWRAGQRLLAIGKAPDPEKAECADRQARAAAERTRRTADADQPVTQHDHVGEECNNAETGGSHLAALMAGVKLRPVSDLEQFKVWFRGYCGWA